VTNSFSKMLQSSSLDFAQLDIAKEGFLACIESFHDREDIAPKIDELLAALTEEGFRVEPPKVSSRDGMSELDVLHQEFQAFTVGIRNEICRRFNGPVLCVTNAIRSIVASALATSTTQEKWDADQANPRIRE
ncbi:hypothetical protein FOL47_001331, partial [Perkinsus chesapeaki]